MRKALFLDLDGTIRSTKGDKLCPSRPEEQEILPGRKEKIWDFKKRGYVIVAVTNQAGIGLGYMREQDCIDCMQDLDKKLGNPFDLMLYSKSKPSEDDPYRKPQPGMLIHAAGKLDLDLENSLMVGDMSSDEGAAKNAKVKFEWAKDFFGDKNEQGT